ncbi:unnamed protein product [Echinostoma caproni]|uniref:Uncharacterized protein n=1 Tax=Echinostoma caproni TaxID=27848 RepID=A0A3P8L709_9TREM|nr:unnamed protein product [Echinostoma caproni]
MREELYMKLGELATIKDSASRTNALKSDMIVRLETNLACQREEFQRKLSELSAQLASREADYRSVTTELALVREQLSNTRPSGNQDRCNEFSPASQLIASMMTSPFGVLTPTGKLNQVPQMTLRSPTSNHLPAPVTPVPSRRRPVMDGTWRLEKMNKSDRGNQIAATTLNETDQPTIQNDPINTAEAALSYQEENEVNPRKRRRHNRSLSISPVLPESNGIMISTVDTAVETDPPVQMQSTDHLGALRYRSGTLSSHSEGFACCFTEPLNLHSLASSLLSITVTESHMRDSQILP